MRWKQLFVIMTAVALLLIAGCERKVTEQITNVLPAESAGYIGSQACSACHSETYINFKRTGHPYKLNYADSAFLPVGEYYPFTSVPLPADLTADDVFMVIGGFRWKARYINNQGEILTGDDRQYNFATDEFVAYDASTAPTKDYKCGPCHMTAYRDDGGHQLGLPGLIGTWEFNGIQCEECHGPGQLHAASPYEVDMKIDRSSEACGKCHIRGAVNKIPASNGFIKHHEQWNEMFTTKHQALQCVDCHNVHYTLHPSAPQTERDMAINLNCENCHLAETESFENTTIDAHLTSPFAPTCIDCHMARAAKSAVAMDTYVGDIRSHLWRINTDSTAEMFTEDGKYANGYLTLEYVCLQCHTTETKGWAARHSSDVHVNPGAPNNESSSSMTISTR